MTRDYDEHPLFLPITKSMVDSVKQLSTTGLTIAIKFTGLTIKDMSAEANWTGQHPRPHNTTYKAYPNFQVEYKIERAHSVDVDL